MALVVQDILDLSCAKGFQLCAGKGGLKRPVELVDMLDFAWTQEEDRANNYQSGKPPFDANSFVISSLMAARDDPASLYQTVQRLIGCGVVGLAYKPVFYEDLPQVVLELADRNDFSIFRISGNATYREIIYEITDAIQLNKNVLATAEILSRILRENANLEDIGALVAKLSTGFRAYTKIMLIMPKQKATSLAVDAAVRRFRLFEEYKGRAAVCGYYSGDRLGMALIATSNTDDANALSAVLRDVYNICSIDPQSTISSQSLIHPTFSEFKQCIYEADCALTAARALGKSESSFDEIGILSFLIPESDNPYVCTFMHKVLQPIVSNDESMKTAIALVRCEGDFEAAANELFLHKNTMRYRIAKIRELIAPDASYESFYEQLSTAVKIYLVREKRAL